MNQLSGIFKTARLARDWTQKEVAEKVGIKQRRYAFYETGDRNPEYDIFVKLVNVLGITELPGLEQFVLREANTGDSRGDLKIGAEYHEKLKKAIERGNTLLMALSSIRDRLPEDLIVIRSLEETNQDLLIELVAKKRGVALSVVGAETSKANGVRQKRLRARDSRINSDK